MKVKINFSKKQTKNSIYFLIGLHIFPMLGSAQNASTSISNINTSVMINTPMLFGITFDARTSLDAGNNFGLAGYYNTNGTVIPEVDAVFNDFPMSTLRYPANAVTYGFDWKKAIGPIASRPNQNLLSTIGYPQPVNFGFDEFMAMTAAKGVSPADIQIMVPIYDSTTLGLLPAQSTGAIADPPSFNADWVEYCNSPNDGSNPGGGIDWAAQRAANGHPMPYGIKIWNIGNEPWASGEFGNTATNCAAYLTYVTPIINAMLAIDSTLQITLPVTGYAANSTSWAYAIINSTLVAQGKIYGVSQHFFLTEDVSNGLIPAGVEAAKTSLTSLINQCTSKGLKVLIGDYAHGINCCSTANDNLAMQWQGANLEADFLLMISQMNNIDRVNFWAYATTIGTFQWKPIRKNSTGNYTLMPAAEIYKKLFPAFLNKSLAVTTSSPMASDGNPYSVRSGAFISTDNSLLNFVAVNRDKTNTVLYQPTTPNGYNLIQARLITASSLQAESINEAIVNPDANGNYSMPPMSILIVENSNISTSITENNQDLRKINIYPNPANEILNFSEYSAEFTITNNLGQKILSGSGNSVSTESLKDGMYYLKTNNACLKFTIKH